MSIMRVWLLGIFHPHLVYRAFGIFSNTQKSMRFNWWTSLCIYIIGYLVFLPLVFGINITDTNLFIFLLVFFLLITFTLMKNYFYTLIISQYKGELVSYQEVAFLTTLSDLTIIFAGPFLYSLSLFLSPSIIFFLFILLMLFLIKKRAILFDMVYNIPTRFVTLVSAGLWFTVFIIIIFFGAYSILSVQAVIKAFLP